MTIHLIAFVVRLLHYNFTQLGRNVLLVVLNGVLHGFCFYDVPIVVDSWRLLLFMPDGDDNDDNSCEKKSCAEHFDPL